MTNLKALVARLDEYEDGHRTRIQLRDYADGWFTAGDFPLGTLRQALSPVREELRKKLIEEITPTILERSPVVDSELAATGLAVIVVDQILATLPPERGELAELKFGEKSLQELVEWATAGPAKRGLRHDTVESMVWSLKRLLNERQTLANTDQRQWRATHRHIKSGGLYMLIHSVQLEADNTSAILYQGKDGTYWVRDYAEFFDGRFEALDTPDTQEGRDNGSV